MQCTMNPDDTAQKQDRALRLEQASLRRTADQARRAPVSCRWIAPDTAQLLSAALDQIGVTSVREALPGKGHSDTFRSRLT